MSKKIHLKKLKNDNIIISYNQLHKKTIKINKKFILMEKTNQ